MSIKTYAIGAAAAAMMSILPATSQSAPLSGAAEFNAGAAAGAVEKAAYRRCWWRHGYQVCRWVGDDYGYYDDGYGYYGPYYGFGPSFGFGGGRHHGGHFHGGHHGGHHR